jgi:hypothetical protein
MDAPQQNWFQRTETKGRWMYRKERRPSTISGMRLPENQSGFRNERQIRCSWFMLGALSRAWVIAGRLIRSVDIGLVMLAVVAQEFSQAPVQAHRS